MTHALTAKELWTNAQNGEKITTQQRRHVLEWLAVMGEITNYTNTDLAKIFGLTERMIRCDRKIVREQAVKALADNKDINLVIADIWQDFDIQRRDLERGKKAARAGTAPFNTACKMIFDMRLQMVKLLQETGYWPTDMVKHSRVHKAIVSSDGSVSTEVIEGIEESRQAIRQAEGYTQQEEPKAPQPQYKALMEGDIEGE